MRILLLVLLLSIPLLSQGSIWIRDLNGSKFDGYEQAEDSVSDGSFSKHGWFHATPDTDGTVYTSQTFDLKYWEGQLNSTIEIDSLPHETTLDDSLGLIVWLDIWDGIDWVSIRIQWYTLSTSGNFTNDSLIVSNDTLIFSKTGFNAGRYYFTTALILNQAWLGFLDIYYTKIRWRLAFLATGSKWGKCYIKQTFQYWQKGK
jgi:hypothetical protein